MGSSSRFVQPVCLSSAHVENRCLLLVRPGLLEYLTLVGNCKGKRFFQNPEVPGLNHICWVALGRPLGFGHVPSHVCCVPSEHGIVFIHSGLVPARIQALPLCCLLQGQPHNALEQNQPPSQKYPQHPKITLPPTLNEIFSYC